MDDEDWTNLQRLVGRDPLPSFRSPETPDHILYANALASYGSGPPTSSGRSTDQLALASALEAYGRKFGPSPGLSAEYSDPTQATGGLSNYQTSGAATQVSGIDPTSSPQQPDGTNGLMPVADKNKAAECRDICSDLALPTKDYGWAFHRCFDTCMGTADWPEWQKYFPRNRSPLPQSPPQPQQAPQAQQPPWWWPLIPFLIRGSAAAAAVAA